MSNSEDLMVMHKINNALPSHSAWQQILEEWGAISAQSTVRHFALPQNIPRQIRSYLVRAHSVGKASIGSEVAIEFKDLYPPFVTDLQAQVMEEAVSLGQRIALEINKPESLPIPAVRQVETRNEFDSTRSSRVAQPSEPEKFDGTRALFGHFLTRLQLRFRSFPREFSQDEAKIRYAGSYLTGNAYTWFQPQVDQVTGDLAFTTFESFINALGPAFDDPDSYATAERELESLRQDGSCAAYYAKMISLFSQLGWLEPKVQIHHFRLGLKDHVKDALVGKNPPKTFPEFAALCIALENDLYARLREKKSKSNSFAQNLLLNPVPV